MNDLYEYQEMLSSIAGKTIAVVYIFEGESAPGAKHYAVWQADVISSWLAAIQELRCMPLILDVRTFVNKAMNCTLPHIDYVVNLNNGTENLSTLGLIPSTCAFLNVPCIPCNSVAALLGENKLLSNIVAHKIGLNVPADLDGSNTNGINRPTNFGSSIGVFKGPQKTLNGLYQKFIPGFDMTTPLLFNPLQKSMEVLPPVMYYPDNSDPQWFLGAAEKETHSSYKKIIVRIDEQVKKHFVSMAKACNINTFCRIDCRIACNTSDEMEKLSKDLITFDKVFFIEINPMPTIAEGINFHTSLQGLQEDTQFYYCIKEYRNTISNPTLTGFILSCAIMSYLIAKH